MRGMKTAALILFPVFFVAGIAWNFHIQRLFWHLRELHPATFERLGKPSVFRRGNNTLAIMKFIFSDQWRELNDEVVENSIRALRPLFVFSIAVFAVMVFLLLAGYSLNHS